VIVAQEHCRMLDAECQEHTQKVLLWHVASGRPVVVDRTASMLATADAKRSIADSTRNRGLEPRESVRCVTRAVAVQVSTLCTCMRRPVWRGGLQICPSTQPSSSSSSSSLCTVR